MSDIQRRITMLWDSRGASQVRASIGQMQSGMHSYRRELQGAQKDQSLLDKQMRAFGTTLRYAIAGGALFGTVQSIQRLGEYQAKLGEIAAIASGPGFDLSGKRLDALGADLLRLSTDTATPISQLQEGVLNLYSTIGEVPPNEAVEIMETIASVARVSQADITDTTQALLGLINAFGKGTDAIPKFGDEFFKVVQLSAGGVDFARTFAQQLGKLSQTANLGGFTPEQSMALTIGSSRFGGSTATNLRGLAQLQRTIITPSAKPTETVLAGIGLPLAKRQQLGGWETLMRILRHANTLGVKGAGRQSTGLVDQLGDDASNEDLGISGAGSTFLSKVWTRAESRNMASIFTQLMTPEQVSGTKNMTLDQYLKEVEESAGAVDLAMDKVMDMRRLQQAGTAMQNFSTAFAQAWSPLLNPAARGITSGSSMFQEFSRDNPAAVMGLTGAAAAAALLARKAGRRVPLRALPVAGAVADTLSGGQNRGDSPMNPLYVIVVAELLGRGRWAAGRNQFPGGQGPAPKPLPPKRSLTSPGRAGLGIIGGAVVTGGAAMWLNDYIGGRQENKLRDIGEKHPAFRNIVRKALTDKDSLTPKQADVIRQLALGRISQAHDMLGAGVGMSPRIKAAVSSQGSAAKVTVGGAATVTINLDQTDAKGNKTTKSTKVPIPLFGSFTPPAPQTAGKNKTTRGN